MYLDKPLIVQSETREEAWGERHTHLRDCICRVWPRNLRATPLVSTSNMTNVPSTWNINEHFVKGFGQKDTWLLPTLPDASRSPLRLNRRAVEWPDPLRSQCMRTRRLNFHILILPVRASGMSFARIKGSTKARFMLLSAVERC